MYIGAERYKLADHLHGQPHRGQGSRQAYERTKTYLKAIYDPRVRILDIRRHNEVGACWVQFSERLQTIRPKRVGVSFGFYRYGGLPFALDYKTHLVSLLAPPVHDILT